MGTPSWVGCSLRGTKQRDFLVRCASVFNTIEGNTAFYALPTADTVGARSRTTGCSPTVAVRFLERIAPLGGKLGTLLVQLPSTPRQLDLSSPPSIGTQRAVVI